jgi:hypothetical protein
MPSDDRRLGAYHQVDDAGRVVVVVWGPLGHVDPRHPQPRVSLFSAYYERAVSEIVTSRGRVVRQRRPAAVRVCGPLVGSVTVVDPSFVREEAARLLDVAATLEELQRMVSV